MQGEFDFRANHYKEFEKQFELEKAAWPEEQKEEARAEAETAWQEFKERQKQRDAELVRQPQYMDVERYLAFWETIRILRERASWAGHRMTYEVKDDRSYGCIRYYADEITHIGDDAGDRTRHLWAEIFSAFDGMSITPADGGICIQISEHFIKRLAPAGEVDEP